MTRRARLWIVVATVAYGVVVLVPKPWDGERDAPVSCTQSQWSPSHHDPRLASQGRADDCDPTPAPTNPPLPPR